jgi:hypothetical protein
MMANGDGIADFQYGPPDGLALPTTSYRIVTWASTAAT